MHKLKILFIVPHEDDEINLAGDLLKQFCAQQYEVFVVYTTNGDYEFKAETRINEALNSLRVFGIPQNHIFFLGYGDMLNHASQLHIFYAKQPVTSPSGHKETYGTKKKMDYSYQYNHRHHSYTRNNYCEDLKKIILQIAAEILFVVDYDEHADHRMVSLTFDYVMGEILSKNLGYHPDVYKGFAYSTAFKAPKDFYSLNLLQTQKPNEHKDLIGTSIYQWTKRIRLPIGKKARGHFLFNSIIFRALCCHKSQNAGFHAESVINSDKVFWKRRTDSLSYTAFVTASSNQEKAYKVKDFLLYNTNDIDANSPILTDYSWCPERGDKEKSLIFLWEDKKEIRYIRLFGNINNDSKIIKIKVCFDDGYQFVLGPFLDNGNPIEALLPQSHFVQKCTLTILEWKGENYGIAECEFYKNITQATFFMPFIKITVGDNFVYRYLVHNNIKCIQFDVYKFNINSRVDLKVIQGRGKIQGNKLILDDDIVKVRAEVLGQPNIYDEITIRRCSSKFIKALKFMQCMEHYFIIGMLRCNRKYIYLRKKYFNDI